METKLSARQKRFVTEYLVDLNGAQAYRRAGYVAKNLNTAIAGASRLLASVRVAAAVQAAMQKREIRTEITQDMVLRELAKIGFQDVRALYRPDGTLIPITELDAGAAASISSVEVLTSGEDQGYARTTKVRLWDKQAALVNIGKHLGMFVERSDAKVEHSGGISLNVNFVKPALD